MRAISVVLIAAVACFLPVTSAAEDAVEDYEEDYIPPEGVPMPPFAFTLHEGDDCNYKLIQLTRTVLEDDPEAVYVSLVRELALDPGPALVVLRDEYHSLPVGNTQSRAYLLRVARDLVHIASLQLFQEVVWEPAPDFEIEEFETGEMGPIDAWMQLKASSIYGLGELMRMGSLRAKSALESIIELHPFWEIREIGAVVYRANALDPVRAYEVVAKLLPEDDKEFADVDVIPAFAAADEGLVVEEEED